MQRKTTTLLLASAAAVPAVGAITAGPEGAMAATSHAKAAATTHKYKGPVVEMHRWGPMQVTISVKSKKIKDVTADVEVHTSRSQFINDQAIPLLHDEVLQAQNADVDEVSGATDTSDAFIESLQGAIKKARQHKALK
jgi:uncharacterized protein with FMN-binding domain